MREKKKCVVRWQEGSGEKHEEVRGKGSDVVRTRVSGA